MNNLINLDTMSSEELKVLQQNIVMKQMDDIQEKIEEIAARQDYQNKQNELKINELQGDMGGLKDGVTHIQEKLHILAVEPAKLAELRNAIKKKVIKQCGGMKNNKYNLFSKLYFDKIGGHLKASLNVPRYDSIRVEDFEVALTIVNRWSPTQKDIKEKLQQYIEDEDSLKESKKRALHSYLEQIGGNL